MSSVLVVAVPIVLLGGAGSGCPGPSQPSVPRRRVWAAPLSRVKLWAPCVLGAGRLLPSSGFTYFVCPSYRVHCTHFTPLPTRPSLGQPLRIDVESGSDRVGNGLLCIIVCLRAGLCSDCIVM